MIKWLLVIYVWGGSNVHPTIAGPFYSQAACVQVASQMKLKDPMIGPNSKMECIKYEDIK